MSCEFPPNRNHLKISVVQAPWCSGFPQSISPARSRRLQSLEWLELILCHPAAQAAVPFTTTPRLAETSGSHSPVSSWQQGQCVALLGELGSQPSISRSELEPTGSTEAAPWDTHSAEHWAGKGCPSQQAPQQRGRRGAGDSSPLPGLRALLPS